MGTFRVKGQDLATTALNLATGQRHKIVVVRPSMFVLDVEDSHFNFDRRVILPDLSSTDGSTPVLDTRRVTGLGVIFAGLTHAKSNASQGMCVTGHTDASGAASYNQALSEDRAKNVSLLLRGKRDDWRAHAASEDNVDDVQTVLTWQHQRAGWDCDPGGIDNKPGDKTHKAISEFQRRYNEEVDNAAQAGLDSPFRKKIGVDGKAGKETWGAIYDLYMTELMDLFDTDKVSDVEQLQQQIKAPPSMKDFVGCGEHIPFTPARRDPFEKGNQEHLEGPQKNPPDRRVEILFFDPGEEVPQICHPAPGKCEPAKCPIYITAPFRQKPIGVPKGLTIAEVNLKLSFRDPEGKVRPFPAGLEVEAKFGDPKDDPGSSDDLIDPGLDDDTAGGDGADAAPAPDPSQADPDAESMAVDQEPNEKTQAGGLLQFVIPRKASSLYLRFLAGAEKQFVTADPKNLDDQKLATEEEARADVGKGRVFFKLPKEFNTQEGYFDDLSGPVTFKDGRFVNVDNRETQIGSRGSPLELILEIHWQHFKFELFDRWTSSATTVPQPRSKDPAGADVPPLVMEGLPFVFEPKLNPGNAFVMSAWDLKPDKDTVHCLAWVRRVIDDAASPPAKRDLPDDQCTARFRAPNLFLRTDGDGSSPDADRKLIAIPAGDARLTTPSVDRLRLYDLPRDWRSTDYPVRLGGETKDKTQPFKNLAATKTAVDKPIVASLDVIVLDDAIDSDNKSPTLDDGSVGHVENRIAIYDNQLKVYKPDNAGKEAYFTRVADLKPAPVSPVLLDFPDFTRLIARGVKLYDVFRDRTCDDRDLPKGFPVGARLAKKPPANPTIDATLNLLFILDHSYVTTKPNGSTTTVFSSFDCGFMGVLRCCGHLNGTVERFMQFQYMSINFNFAAVPKTPTEKALTNPPQGAAADAKAADCLGKVSARWNGVPAVYHVGQPETARGEWRFLLTRGQPTTVTPTPDGEVRVNIFGTRRATQAGKEGNWELKDMDIKPGNRLTAAHELGHALSLPDEYLNTDDEPSGGFPNIIEQSRSPGTPYGLDVNGQMGGGERLIRTRSLWHTALWARERGYFGDAAQIMIEHGTAKFTTAITPRASNRVQFATASALNVDVPMAFGTGFCDQFLYVTGADEWSGGELGGSSPAHPYDGFITVRVKMDWSFDNTTDFDDIESLLVRADQIVTTQFNVSKHLVARGIFQGKPVRLRYLFCPRYVLHTFPTKGARQSSYLDSLTPALPKKDAASYTPRADGNVNTHGVHAIIHVSSGGGTPGVTPAASSPRRALVREDGLFSSRFDDDFALVFAQLVGLTSANLSNPNDFKPLADQLPGGLTGVRLTFE